ncbi:DUF504 domain-containing protein [Candidatus Woesearchaeota archaeon]|nr:DUF504 domain-containing protein [Candidatus Woesearchaeota archaeon]
MFLREQDRHFIWSLLVAIGIIFIWKGLWEGLYEIPYLGNEWVALFVGFAILTFSGLIIKEFDPSGSLEKAVRKIVHKVKNHPQKHEFHIKYYDKVKKKQISVPAGKIVNFENDCLIVKDKSGKREIFIPAHRITEAVHKGKSYWKL